MDVLRVIMNIMRMNVCHFNIIISIQKFISMAVKKTRILLVVIVLVDVLRRTFENIVLQMPSALILFYNEHTLETV